MLRPDPNSPIGGTFLFRNIDDVNAGTLIRIATMYSTFGWDTNSIISDPQFVNLSYGCGTNSASNNYRITTTSLCSLAGTNLTALDLPGLGSDFLGNPRPTFGPWDIGAYEH